MHKTYEETKHTEAHPAHFEKWSREGLLLFAQLKNLFWNKKTNSTPLYFGLRGCKVIKKEKKNDKRVEYLELYEQTKTRTGSDYSDLTELKEIQLRNNRCSCQKC